MTPKNIDDPSEDDSLGVLDDAASLDTTGIGILGGTAQVSVALPKDEDDDLTDDGVVDGEIVTALIVDETPVDEAHAIGRINAADIIIEIPVEPLPAVRPEVSASPEGDEPAAVAESDETPPQAEQSEEDTAAGSAPSGGPNSAGDAIVDAASTTPPEPKKPSKTEAARENSVTEGESATGVQLDEPPLRVEAEDPAEGEDAAAAARFLARAKADIAAPATTVTSLPNQKEVRSVDRSDDKALSTQPARVAARAEMPLTSKRLDQFGDSSRESADLLTADRLLDPHQLTKPEPEGAWSHFLYTISGRRINIGDGRRARERKALTAKIAAPLAGGARFVPVLSRKGGVGKTTITALLGMALADAREDRVIAVDANPDRGTLADRIVKPSHNKSVRDLVRIHDDVRGYHDLSAIVARDATRLDVLASDSDPRVAEAFSDSDYRDVAGVAAHYYSLVLTDTGTGIVHSVMSATLDLADQIVIVSGLSVDEARLASETLTWLETNGYTEQAREAIIVLNQSTPGAPLVRLNELEAHFATRAKGVVRVPYDVQIAGGGAIVFANLQPETRKAARELAALLVEGLRAKAA